MSSPPGEGRPGSYPLTLPPPPLRSRVHTYLAGPRARGGHGPRSSFPGSGRIPCRPAAPPPPQEPGPAPALHRPIACCRSRRHPIGAGVACWSRPRSCSILRPAVQGGWGRDAVVGVPGREDTPSPNSPQGWRTGAPLGEVGKLNTVPPTHSGVKFPATGGNQGLERE